jgi:hypothetical protein
MLHEVINFIARQIINPKLSVIYQHKQDGNKIILSYSQAELHEGVCWNEGIPKLSLSYVRKNSILNFDSFVYPYIKTSW